MRSIHKCALRALAVGVVAYATTAHADLILPGVYQLNNHPDGAEVPPPYGMRLDEMVDVTGGHDVFTFDFEHAQSDMRLYYNDIAQTIIIDGHVYGGRDIGGAWAADAFLGVYDVHFEYNLGVQLVPGDDDLYTPVPSFSNYGTITRPGGAVHELSDKSAGDYTFRFGDEDDDNGHRFFNPGISGWGWLMVDSRYSAAMDWLFTAEYIAIPEPASAVVLGFGALLAAARRRR